MSEALVTAPAPTGLHPNVVKRGVTESQWNTLCKSLYPGANPNSVLMVVDYCAARRLDPLKKPCHIVPMRVKDAKSGNYEWRDVVMPGIYEYRTTAQRTGEYLGHSKPAYGPMVTFAGVEAPEWCDITAYRWNASANMRVEFPVTVYFREVVATKNGGDANDRWSKAPIQMLTKCAEAAALREAFPDEIGGEQTAEEMDGQRAHVIDVETLRPAPSLVKPENYDDWRLDLFAAAENGPATLEGAWAGSSPACRTYMTTTEPDAWESLKAKAQQNGGQA